ncbi:MAG: hypothetical protein JWM21_1324 [Acidobacteria bacterium]|nr:hypothetical protein [Acidobacteriota bacterium]
MIKREAELSAREEGRKETEGGMIQSETTNDHIAKCAKDVLAALGRPDDRLTVWQISLVVPKEFDAKHDANDPAGAWELRLSNGNVYPLSLTFKQTYDSEELKATILRCLT